MASPRLGRRPPPVSASSAWRNAPDCSAEPGSRLDGGGGPAANRSGTVTIRVVVADDQEMIRTGLTMILNAQPDIEVVGSAADGRAAVDIARRLRPEVCLF